MSFEDYTRLINKESNKGIDQVINLINTNPLFLNKPSINKAVYPEPSIRDYYNIQHLKRFRQ